MIERITITDLTIERGTATWGGPTAKVTVNAGPLAGSTYWLRSTQGLGSETTNDLAKGGGIHLDNSDPDASTYGWMGAYKTFDMDEAIGDLVGDINDDFAVRKEVQEGTWQERSALAEAIGAFDYSLDSAISPRDFRAEWLRVQQAVAAIEMKIQEVTL